MIYLIGTVCFLAGVTAGVLALFFDFVRDQKGNPHKQKGEKNEIK